MSEANTPFRELQIKSGGTRPYVFDREGLAYFLIYLGGAPTNYGGRLYKKSLRRLFAGGFAPHKQSNLIQKLHRNMRI